MWRRWLRRSKATTPTKEFGRSESPKSHPRSSRSSIALLLFSAVRSGRRVSCVFGFPTAGRARHNPWRMCVKWNASGNAVKGQTSGGLSSLKLDTVYLFVHQLGQYCSHTYLFCKSTRRGSSALLVCRKESLPERKISHEKSAKSVNNRRRQRRTLTLPCLLSAMKIKQVVKEGIHVWETTLSSFTTRPKTYSLHRTVYNQAEQKSVAVCRTEQQQYRHIEQDLEATLCTRSTETRTQNNYRKAKPENDRPTTPQVTM